LFFITIVYTKSQTGLSYTALFGLSVLSSACVAQLPSNTTQSIQQVTPPIVQPGAPGQSSRTLSAQDAVKIANTSFTRDDALFMQNMIPHHGQAVDMAVLVEDRTNNEKIIDIAGRIRKSQADEIAFMRDWLEQRAEVADIDHSMHMDHSLMGMASSNEMDQLKAAKGTEFDRLFLSLMIPHHEGAVTMVEDLLEQSGSAYDPILYDFINDIVNDQEAEITRMDTLLSGLSTDKRVGLQAGFRDAGEAALNLKLIKTLPRPNGFFDPNNPSNLPPVKMPSEDDKSVSREDEDGGDAKTEWAERWPLLSFWNTDMAFVSSDEDTIVVCNSGTAGVRDEDELEGCIGDIPGDNRTALFRIDVIEIPVKNPEKARITSSPAVFADDEGRLSGLWRGGDHGEGTQRTKMTDQCHDITVFPALKLAAGACSGNGILLDITDPLQPKRIDAVSDPGFAYWHSATFNNDGTKVLFTDEWGGGTKPRCRASDPKSWGANAFYDVKEGRLTFQSYYKIDAPQSEQENCVAHNGSVVPVPGRDIFVQAWYQAWYQGGLSVIDFSDTANPVEIAYFDRGPIHDERMVIAGYWSTYWYNGKIYGTEILRGLDVMDLQVSEFLTENELAAAKLANMGDTFNPQQQFQVTWPANPVIGLAYVDQLERDGGLSQANIDAAKILLNEAQNVMSKGDKSAKLSTLLVALARDIAPTKDDVNTQKRIIGLTNVLNDMSEVM
jgi:uncharacterized protein (DUF305 family)